MPFQPRTSQPVLQVIACGSPLAADIGEILRPAVADGWDVWVVTSHYGARFLDVAEAEAVTGHPVHSRYRHPDEPVDVPYADAIVVVPATCNTLAKWASGICDTLALGLLVEAYGRGCPVTAVPFSNRAHLAHPAIVDSIDRLRRWGVTVLVGDDFHPPHEPGVFESSKRAFPWNRVHEAITLMKPVTCRR